MLQMYIQLSLDLEMNVLSPALEGTMIGQRHLPTPMLPEEAAFLLYQQQVLSLTGFNSRRRWVPLENGS